MFGFLLASFFILLLGTVSSQTVFIQYISTYYSQRDCASNCQAIYPIYPPDLIAEYLSCATDPIENSCFCSADLQSDAENHIQTCVEKRCCNTLDANNAVSIYDAYYTSAGFVKAAFTTAVTTTRTAQGSSATSTIFTSPLTACQMPYILTNTQSTDIGSSIDSSSASGKTFGGLTKAELIGTIIGYLGVVVSAIGAYYTWKPVRK